MFRKIFSGYKWQLLLALLLVLVDAGLLVLFPLFIGYAIDDALIKEYHGSVLLGLLGLTTLLIGAFRRFYDSRLYARIYEKLGLLVGGQFEKSASTRTAHLGFLTEVVEFFENSIPEIITNLIGLIGTLIIIGVLDVNVFMGCLGILLVIAIIYGASEKRTTQLNAGYNDEQESQVNVVSQNQLPSLQKHLRKLMQWNIRLSDLETINFSIVWLFMMGFLVITIVVSVEAGTSYGALFSLILYLFQFIESTTVMPLFYQQWLRLKEIANRLVIM